MNNSEIKKLKLKTFPYLDKTDVRLDISDRSIVQRELDLTTDSVLTEHEKADIVDFFCSMIDCLSTYDNPSVDSFSKSNKFKTILYKTILNT